MQPNKPTLSVLVPAYNAEKYIEQTLKSIFLQTYDDFEILVCDDCSQDETLRVINSFVHSKLKVFKNDANLGKNKTAAFLLGKANGDYITVHDADDISLPQRFEKQINFLLSNLDYALCGTNFISFLDDGKLIDRSHLAQHNEIIKIKIKMESQFHGPTVMFRKSIVSEVGGFYRYFTRAEDIDFTMRVAQKFNVANLPEYLYLYRHVKTSLTNDISGYSVERLGHIKLLCHLHEERERNHGIDSIMSGDDNRLRALMEEFTAEYKHDPTIALRRGVFRLLGMRMYSNALLLSLVSLRKKLNLLNLKCIVYTFFACLKGYWQLFNISEKVDLDFLNSYKK